MRCGGVAPRPVRTEDPVADAAEELLLIGEMPVQGTRGDVQVPGEPTHRQVAEAVFVEDLERRGEDTFPVQMCSDHGAQVYVLLLTWTGHETM